MCVCAEPDKMPYKFIANESTCLRLGLAEFCCLGSPLARMAKLCQEALVGLTLAKKTFANKVISRNKIFKA